MSFMAGPARAITDQDGFAPPSFGGAVAVKYGQVTYHDNTAKHLFSLPAGAVIVAWLINVSTAFNAGTSNQMDVGDAAVSNRFADNVDVSTAGQIVNGYDSNELFTQQLSETSIYAIYVPTGTTPTAGSATVACFYIVR